MAPLVRSDRSFAVLVVVVVVQVVPGGGPRKATAAVPGVVVKDPSAIVLPVASGSSSGAVSTV